LHDQDSCHEAVKIRGCGHLEEPVAAIVSGLRHFSELGGSNQWILMVLPEK
jgi:hypothetical protein